MREAGVDRTYISPLDRGVYSASVDMVEKLAAVLGVETDTLLHHSAAKAGRKKPLPSGADHCEEPTQAGSVREQ